MLRNGDMGGANMINIYRRNKNIFLEGIEGGLLDKVGKRIFNVINRCLFKKAKPVISERIIEYPLLFQHLSKDSKNILDFGCVEDLLPLHLCSLGYKVTGLDFRPYPFAHDNFTFIQADILSWEPPEEVFDTVISISTIEHVGLASYGDPLQENGDKIAVEKLWHALKKGGDLIVTLPAGKPFVGRGMRIYDAQMINNLIPNIETIRFFHKSTRYGQWKETTGETVSTLEYDEYYKTCPVQGVAFVIARKDYPSR